MVASLLDLGSSICGLATWVVPMLLFAAPWNRKPRSSLAAVGFTISLFVVAACWSAASIVLALLTFVFAQRTGGAWLGLSAIAAFWVSLGVSICIGGLRARAAPSEKPDKS